SIHLIILILAIIRVESVFVFIGICICPAEFVVQQRPINSEWSQTNNFQGLIALIAYDDLP
ncbi:MAG TPA: hypothetical protein VLE70_21395, partial [Anaerolineae bacterium]|nr:hypothetical protein [Anaerolineae bacterium]